MHKVLLGLLLFSLVTPALANEKEVCSGWPSWTKPACERLHQVWAEGKNEVYLSGYAWHNRYTYTRAKVKTYNENAWGGGLGKSFYDEKGNWHGLYAIAFLDSHKKLEPALGYAYLKMAHPTPNLGLGVGYTILVTARPDIYHNIPFPGILPWASINFRNLAVSATYIPGAAGAGNVLYVVGKWTINW